MNDHDKFSTLQFEAYLDEFCGSPFWNTTLTWNTTDPTFTACFEKTVLVWIPVLFLWIFAPFEIIGQIESFNKDIPWTWKNSLKFFINTLICTICVSDFIANTNNCEIVAKADIFMPLLKLVTFGLALLLAYRNKIHGVPSSGPLFLFWLLSTFCGIPQFRSEIRYAQGENSYDYYEYFSYIVYYPLIVAMFILNCFYDGVPRVYPYGKFENPSPEPLASFLSKKTVYFFEHFMYKAFRNPVEMKNLWDLEPENQAGNLIPKFDKYFNRRIEKGINKFTRKTTANLNNESSVSLIKVKKRKDTNVLPVLWKCLWRPLTGGMIIRLITDSLQFVNPQLLGLVIGFVGSIEPQPLWKGILYATIMFVVAEIMSFANTTHANWFFRIGQQSKTILISAIYRKSLRISNSARKNRTVGEIVNLMSTDAQKLQEVVMFLNFLLSAPLSIALALFFLYQELGIASLAGLVTMLALIPINILIVNRSRNLQIKQMKFKDERIKIMNEVLTGMKVLKLYAWEECFEKEISKIRNKEIVTLKKAAYLNGVSQFFWNCTPFMVSCATFAVYVTIDPNKNRLDVAKAFVSIALLNVLRGPMALLPGVINQIIQTLVSIRRINSFLNADELEFYVTHNQNNEAPILIEDGTFSWGEEPILRNINLKVFGKNLTAIVGAVGTGKSSLISAILGEMDKITGSINIFGSVAYVPQQSWLQNATVQDNITFGKAFEKEKYIKIIEACALRADFNMLPNGDQTEIGEKGINLSGGQKQRISLARAVYADCDIYLLDDPLSAVDAHVGKHIFTHLIGSQGLLSKKTRILVTHAITYLPQTDNIVVLKDGKISEDGTYQELLAKKGHFSDFILQHITENINNKEELNEIESQIGNIQLPKDVSQTLTRQISRQRSRISESESISSLDLHEIGKSSSRESLKGARRPSIPSKRKMSPNTLRLENGVAMKNSPKKGKLITEENAEKGNVKLAIFAYYLKSIGICSIVGTLIGSILFQSFSVGSTAWLGQWAEDENMIKNNETNIPLRNLYLGVYGGMGACLGLSIFAAAIIFAQGAMNAAKTLHNFMLHNILRLPMTFFDTTPSGRILSRFSTDILSIDLRLPMALNVFFIQGFRIIFTFAVIIYTTPIFTLAIIPLLGLYIFIQRYYVATSIQLKRIDSVSRSPIYSKFSETLSGTHIIRAYNHVERFVNQSDEQINKNQQAMYASNTASIWLTIRLENIGNAIIFFSALFAVLSKNIDPALIGMSVSYAMTITGTLNFLVRMVSDVETTIISVERLKEYGEIPQEAPWNIAEKTPSKEWPQKGLVEFKNYSLKYRKELDLVLKSINFKIMGGEKVGIVGRTGAGKSSLTLALFRIIEAAEGAILIDGYNISEMGLHALRSRLTIIPQDAVLFSGSIRMNLDPFEQCSDEEVWKALELAHLKDFIKSLTGGLAHTVTEGGENLSVGQRQLICLARALLRKTKILILDEATAAIDLETDELIQITIRTAFKDCTVLTIAHRLDTIIDSERVLVLDKGEIAEFDQPDVLLENKNSIFFSMCKDAGLVS